MKKYLILLIIVLSVFLFWIFPKPAKAMPSLDILPTDSGPRGAEIIFNGSNFCVHNPGTLVNILWDGNPIKNGSAPAFQVSYTVPLDAEQGQHTILATASCPGQLPDISPSEDQITIYFTVISSEEDSATLENSDNSDDSENSTQIKKDNEEATDSDEENQKSEKKQEDQIPWYLNWVYCSLLGGGILLIIGGIIWGVVVKKKKVQSKEAVKTKEVEKIPEKKVEVKEIPQKDKKKKEEESESKKSRIEFEE